MMEEADTNKNTTIELDEFITVIKNHRDDSNPRGWGRLRLYDSIQGKQVFDQIVDSMTMSVEQDPDLRPYFMGINVRRVI
jgi:hypothetical protein